MPARARSRLSACEGDAHPEAEGPGKRRPPCLACGTQREGHVSPVWRSVAVGLRGRDRVLLGPQGPDVCTARLVASRRACLDRDERCTRGGQLGLTARPPLSIVGVGASRATVQPWSVGVSGHPAASCRVRVPLVSSDDAQIQAVSDGLGGYPAGPDRCLSRAEPQRACGARRQPAPKGCDRCCQRGNTLLDCCLAPARGCVSHPKGGCWGCLS